MDKLYHVEIGGKDYVLCATVNANLRIAEKYESVQKCFGLIVGTDETTEGLLLASLSLLHWYLEEGCRRAAFDNVRRADGTEYEPIPLEALGTLITGQELGLYVNVCAAAWIGGDAHEVDIEDDPKNAQSGGQKAGNGSSRKQG
ncbi:MAG: hypothetical protein LBS91_02950 [Clostridiales Family XIII bacterium]|jgi:hypothetical protein|nr:hypothetical protein [Clostridiales Family XIII bacterium]